MAKGKPLLGICSGRGGDVYGRRLLLEGVAEVSSAPSTTPDENPRSSDRVVAALWCRALLEDAALELTACFSPEVAWRPSSCSLRQSLYLVLHLGVSCAGLRFSCLDRKSVV